jgi:pimeloyl-ACP methyl ester carboxylesterase
MTPTFFGDSAAPLFGVLHEPSPNRSRAHGVLLCPPIAQEYVRSHWAIRQLAASLERAGFACLRFDWYGVGDSAGDLADASVARWQADAVTAAQELRDSAGVKRVSLVGVRFGAAVALTAAAKIKPASLVLWDPIDGPDYISELRALHVAARVDPNRFFVRSPEPHARPTELVGVDFGAQLLRELEGTAYDLPADGPSTPVCLLDSTGGREAEGRFAALEAQLRERGFRVETAKAQLRASWTSVADLEELLLPSDAVHSVTRYLETQAT